MTDIPCGDLFWIADILPMALDYIGGDVVEQIVQKNREKFGHLGQFIKIDLTRDRIPKVDLILVRDCFIHLPNIMVIEALKNISSSDIMFALMSTYDGVDENIDIDLGEYRPINLQLPPFSLPSPLEIIRESEGRDDLNGKSLALWHVSQLNAVLLGGNLQP